MSTTRDVLVVGIDFGTTFSGVAAAYSGNVEAANDISVIQTGITSDKVPTEVSYTPPPSKAGASIRSAFISDAANKGRLLTDYAHDDNGRSEMSRILAGYDRDANTRADVLRASHYKAESEAQRKPSSPPHPPASDGVVRWGLQSKLGEQRLHCLKLYLDPSQGLPSYISWESVHEQLATSGKLHTKEILERRHGKDLVSTANIHIILTVPAVWFDAAKHATLVAAQTAGIDHDIALISEPEAAAVYVLQAIQLNPLKAGHNFVVVDAGGGTVDLVSYTIKQIAPFRLEEIVAGSGGCCGAEFLNIQFLDLVRSRLGPDLFSHVVNTKPQTWFHALRYFEEHLKRDFDPDEDAEFSVPFPGLADNESAGVESGFLTITSAEIRGLLKPVIVDVVKLVEGQLQSLASAGKQAHGLILFGGFGQSECLLRSLRDRFASKGIEILQPVNAWTAVVRGAVLRGLESRELVIIRRSRRHHGVVIMEPFDATMNPESCRIWEDTTEKFMATNRMK